jgi:F-type H+-transporting ATPase subunit b
MEALTKLGIDFKILIAQFINFGILLLLLRYLLYRPIQKILDKRAAKVKESIEKAQDIDKKHALAEKQYEDILSDANKKAESIIKEAKSSAENVRKEILEKAEKEAGEKLAAAEVKIGEERKALYSEIRQSAGRLAVTLMTKVLKQDLDEEFCRKSVDKALKEVEV